MWGRSWSGRRPRPRSDEVGRRHRQREKLAAPTSEYRDSEGNVLALRGSLSPASRREYQAVLSAGLDREDAEQRALEFLFEHLAKSWTIAGLGTDRPKDLLARFRVASSTERQFVREAIRAHAAENFPELPAP
jgi:hypothetical protein